MMRDAAAVMPPGFLVDIRSHMCYAMITGVNSETDELYALLRNMEGKKRHG